MNADDTSTQRPSRGRVHYRDAGRAQRHARRAARDAGASPFQRDVLAVVCDLTASYSKLSDYVNLGAIVTELALADTARSRERVGQALRWLADAGVIGYRPGQGRHRSLVTLHPAPPESPTSQGEADPPCEVGDPSHQPGGDYRVGTPSRETEQDAGAADAASSSPTVEQLQDHLAYTCGLTNHHDLSPAARAITRQLHRRAGPHAAEHLHTALVTAEGRERYADDEPAEVARYALACAGREREAVAS